MNHLVQVVSKYNHKRTFVMHLPLILRYSRDSSEINILIQNAESEDKAFLAFIRGSHHLFGIIMDDIIDQTEKDLEKLDRRKKRISLGKRKPFSLEDDIINLAKHSPYPQIWKQAFEINKNPETDFKKMITDFINQEFDLFIARKSWWTGTYDHRPIAEKMIQMLTPSQIRNVITNPKHKIKIENVENSDTATQIDITAHNRKPWVDPWVNYDPKTDHS